MASTETEAVVHRQFGELAAGGASYANDDHSSEPDRSHVQVHGCSNGFGNL